jgi:hypothetical protein
MARFGTFIVVALIALTLSITTITRAAAQDGTAGAPIAEVIQGQLDAFAAGDPATAYSFAAPTIQRKFGDAETFMRMVRQGYGALIDPAAVDFQRFEQREGRAVQSVRVLARDGTAWMAHYLMERMEDGTWRIAGCHMEQIAAESA